VKPISGSRENTRPYTLQEVDNEITHFERVLNSGDLLFPEGYWRGRILQAYATQGLTRTQQEHLQRLLDRIATRSA
jgi:hypothetical protein